MIIAFAGVQGRGQTFMDWSFHFLQGKDTYWNYRNGEQPLVQNPNTNTNAHNHDKNHPLSEEEIKNFISQARQRLKTSDDIITFYPFLTYQDDMKSKIGGLNNLLAEHDIEQFWIKPTRPYPYFFERTGTPKHEVINGIKNWLGVRHDDINVIREMVSFKMQGNRKRWLEEVEILYAGIEDNVDMTFTDVQWQYDTESCMNTIFDHAGLGMDIERIDQWRGHMNEWRKNTEQMVQWYEKDAPHIAEMIVQNQDLDLRPFNFDLLDEATVMSLTMLNHGKRLVIPTAEFPKNTKILHQLIK